MISGDDSGQLPSDMWRKIASYAYVSFREAGCGAVLVRQVDSANPSEAELLTDLEYVPWDPQNDLFPDGADAMIDEYDPEKEVVLMIVNAENEGLCLQLSSEKLGCTPLSAYRDEYGPYHYLPGDYLKLTRLIDDVEPGFYIYLRRERAWLVLCRAGLDEMDELCATDKTVRVHAEFDLALERVAGIVVG